MEIVNKGGRVAVDGAQDLRAKSVMLDRQTIRTLQVLGNGNLSAGIRAAARQIIRANEKRKPK